MSLTSDRWLGGSDQEPIRRLGAWPGARAKRPWCVPERATRTPRSPDHLARRSNPLDGTEMGNICSYTVPRVSPLTDSRLDSLYVSDGFGGEKTMRAKVIRELIDEIRALRQELEGRTPRRS